MTYTPAETREKEQAERNNAPGAVSSLSTESRTKVRVVRQRLGEKEGDVKIAGGCLNL